TKIEAASNKYTFVWKKAVTKNLKRLLEKIENFVSECAEAYGFKTGYKY
ncbi:MAG: IS5/IS1182 family transposase, partial [Clostridium sp.]|nr:IS5/IS1182 family transposase [Clostridium sp.]